MAQTGCANFDKGYRYVRYSQFITNEENAGGHTNVAEVEFYYGSVKATGTVFGTSGSCNNSGMDYTKVFDGNISTYMDYPSSTGGYAGLDLGVKQVGVSLPRNSIPKVPRVRINARSGLIEANDRKFLFLRSRDSSCIPATRESQKRLLSVLHLLSLAPDTSLATFQISMIPVGKSTISRFGT